MARPLLNGKGRIAVLEFFGKGKNLTCLEEQGVTFRSRERSLLNIQRRWSDEEESNLAFPVLFPACTSNGRSSE